MKLRVAIVMVALMGIVLSVSAGPVPGLLLLGIAVAATVSLPKPSAPPPPFSIDEKGVSRALSDGRTEAVEWGELVEVWILTTADGPFCADFFWVLRGSGDRGCVVPSEHAGDLLERLQRLPGFDNAEVIRASGCTDEARFVCWRGAPGDGLVGAKARGKESAGC